MSTEIDQRVVEMRFDNKHFEANVQTTMSSLDKLKQKLRLDNASKGLENVNSAAKKVDMTHLGKGLEMVQARFSALQVIGVTALANITNSAVNAGKRIASALTIDPIKTGFQEYETQMNAVQTILANTQSKGSTLKDVNAALDELNTYADKTIYNFTEMTRNIGTFTAAGVDLDTSVNAIQGIANLAAVSGSTSQQASTAMYQLSQALASGTVKLMDWNSVVNAGMGGQVFQDALKETSRLLGTGADAAIKAEGSFRESLSTGWLTAEVLTETLKKFTESGANERVAEYTGLSKEAVAAALESAKAQYGEADAIKYASKALAEKSGKNADEIEKTLKFAQTATDAATKVKTFSQLWDVMKESAQSGWAQTWKLIIGDFEQAKNLLTPLADFFTGVINKMSEARNKLLKGALGDRFSKLSKSLNKLLEPAKSAVKVAETATGAVKDLSKIVDQVIIGKFGNGKDRIDALTKAGYNYYEVQNKVNEKLGDSFRYTVKNTDAQKDSVNAQKNLGKTEAKRLETLANMSDAELKSLGYSKEQIKAFRDLKKEADKLGMSVSDFVKNIDQLDGRTILINSFKNVGQGLVSVFKALKDAWREIFPPMTSDNLYNIIAGIHKFSTYCVVSDETADKLKRTMKGLFAIVKIVATILGGPLKLAFKILSQFLSVFDLDILSVTATIGDAIVKFSEWLDSVLDFTDVFEKIKPAIEKAIEVVKEWCKAIKESDFVSNIINGLKNGAVKAWSAASEFAKNIIKGIKDKLAESEFVSDLMSGLVNGLKDGATKVWNSVKEFAQNIIDTICKVLGIESPSTVMFAIGGFLISGLILGIKGGLGDLLSSVGDVAKSIVEKVSDGFGKIDWSAITQDFMMVGALFPKARIFALGTALARWFGSIGGDTVSGLIEGIKNKFGGVIETLKNLASTIVTTVCSLLGIESPSRVMMTIGAFLISGLIVGMVNSETGLFKELGTICTGIYKFVKENISKLADWISTIELPELNMDTLISAGLLVGVVLFVKKMLNIFEQFGKGVSGFGKMCSSAGTLIDNLNNKFFPDLDAKKTKMESFATTLLKLSISLAIVAGAAKLLSTISWPDLAKAGVAIGVLGGIMIALTALVRKHGKDIPKISGMLLSLSTSILLLTAVVAIIGHMEWDTIGKGLSGIASLVLIIAMFVQGISAYGPQMPKISGMLLALSAGLLMLTGVIAIMGNMEWATIGKGLSGIGGLMLLIGLFAGLMSMYAKDMPKLSAFLISLSFGLLLLTGVIAMIGNMEWGTIGKGLFGIGALMVFIGLFVQGISMYGKDMPRVAGLIMSLSAGLLILTGVIAIIGHMEWTTIGKGLFGIGALMVFIGLFVQAISMYSKDIPKVSALLLTLSLSLAILATVFAIIGIISWDGIWKGIAAMGALSAFMTAMIWATRGASDCKGNLMMMAIAIGVMAGAIAGLSFIDQTKLQSATLALTSVMGMFAILTYVAGQAKGSIGMMVTLTVAIGILAGALWLIAGLPVANALAAAGALGGLMLLISGAMYIMSNLGPISTNTVAALGIMTVALGVLAGALWLISGLPVANALAGAAALSVLMLALSGSMVLISYVGNISTNTLAALGIMTIALGVLGGALWLIAGMPIANALVGAAALSVLMIVLSGAMLAMSSVGPSAIAGAAAMVLMAGALAILTPQMQALGGISLAEIGKGLLALAGAFGVIGVAGLVLGPISPLIMALAVAIGLIGVGCLSAGVGLMNFASGLAMLATIGPAGLSAITMVLTGLISLIPTVAIALANGIIQFATTIAAGAPVLAAAAVSVIMALIAAITTTIPAVIQAVGVLLDAFLKFIVTYIPKMVNAGMKLILGILQGIAKNIKGIVKAATDIIVNFIDGISAGIPRVINSAIKLMISFINGLADGIRGNSDTMINAVNNLMDAVISAISKWFKNAVAKGGELVKKLISGVKSKFGAFKGVAKDLISGFIKGIKEKFGAVKDAAVNCISGAVDKVKSFLGIKSPSKLFAQMGRYVDEGMAVGLIKYAKIANGAAGDLGMSVLKGLQDSLDIHSPARLIRDEVGRYVVQGLAEGITKDMSAEEAAEKKASNIASAFKTELDKADLEAGIIDAEQQLWESYNPNASESDKALVKMESLIKKRDEQLKNVKLADEEYLYTLKTFGADAKATKEAYKKSLQEQIDLEKIMTEINTSRNTLKEQIVTDAQERMDIYDLEQKVWEAENENANETTKSLAQISSLNKKKAEQAKIVAQREQEYLAVLNKENATTKEINTAYKALLQSKIDAGNITSEIKNAAQTELDKYAEAKQIYDDYIREHKRELLDKGFTMEQIMGQAEGQAWSQTGIFVNSFDPKQFEQQINTAKTVGTDLVANFATGVNASTPTATNAITNMSAVCTSTVQAEQVNWYANGCQFVQDFAAGIRDNTYQAVEAITEMVGASKSALITGLSQIITDLINGDIDTTPIISPVLDLSGVQNGVNHMNGLFMGNRSLGLAANVTVGFDNINNRLDGMAAAIRANSSENSKITNAITELRGDFGDLINAINNMDIRLDDNTVVGRLAGKIDSKLGQIANHKGRVN